MNTDASQTLTQYQARVDAALDARLPAADVVPERLHAAIRYATLQGGKRIRPALVYATGELLGAPAGALDAAAAAVEMIHSYSLIHDDLPAMDDDDLRRGRPTCHKAYDEATAILAGDALQVLAFESLADAPIGAEERIGTVRILARASGTHGMAGGQAIDLASVGKTLNALDVERMHRYKTGALLEASVLLAIALAGREGSPAAAALIRYAKAIGLAFQIVDDVLDIEGDPSLLGKTIGADLARGKPTYPAAVGLDAARQRAHALMAEASAALDHFGDDSHMLRWLGDFIVNRQS
jgi:geranylgeranyl pyrophosphate synthase